jgi:hypothetical protein
MSRLLRALVVGAAVAALSLAPTAAVAQDHLHHPDQGRSHDQQVTRVAPAELEAGQRAEATRQALAERWSSYYHATRLSPAELAARTQATERSADPAEPAAWATAPPRSDGPIGQPGWLVVVPVGMLAALVVGLAALAARFSDGGPPRVRPAV